MKNQEHFQRWDHSSTIHMIHMIRYPDSRYIFLMRSLDYLGYVGLCSLKFEHFRPPHAADLLPPSSAIFRVYVNLPGGS
jgi:hypothetical protein